MKNFYDRHYNKFEISTIPDITSQRVWNIYFDETNDLIYVFVAKIKQTKSKKKRGYKEPKVEDPSQIHEILKEDSLE